MLKKFSLIAVIFVSLAMIFAACGGEDEKPKEYTVTFDLNSSEATWDDDSTGQKKVKVTSTIGNKMPAAPKLDGYGFAGWKDINDKVFNKTTKVTKNITLYAQWELDLPPMVGYADITGTFRIGETLEVALHITEPASGYILQWMADDQDILNEKNSTYVIKGVDAGKFISCVVSHTEYAPLTASGSNRVPFDIFLDISIHPEENLGDSATADPLYGHVGDTITLDYTLSNTKIYNQVFFSGVTGINALPITVSGLETEKTGQETFVISQADADGAQNGVITVSASFSHSDKLIETIVFPNSGAAVTKTYGDAKFTHVVGTAGAETTARPVVYAIASDSAADVATVDSATGEVTILKAGNTRITATKEEDGTHDESTAHYELTVHQKQLTITGTVVVKTRAYESGNTAATVTTVGTLQGIVGSDTVTVDAAAHYYNDHVGTAKEITVVFTIAGANAGNYIKPIDIVYNDGEITEAECTDEVCTCEPGIALVRNPVLGSNDGQGPAQGTWNGTVIGNTANWISGAIRYQFPADTTDFKIADYDFVEIEYESTTAGTGNIVCKQYNNGTDYGFASPLYPTLAASGKLKFEIRGAGGTGGVALQKHSGSDSANFKIIKVTFTKGVRKVLTFDLGSCNSETYPIDGPSIDLASSSVTIVETTKFGNLPTPTWKSEYIFSDWKLGETNITPDTVLTSALTGTVLVAQWTYMPPVSVDPITVNTTGKVVAKLGSITFTEDAGGNGYTVTGGTNYDWTVVSFKVTLPDGVSLANYDTISFTFTPVSGDLNNKTFSLLNATGTMSGGSGLSSYIISTPSDSTGGTATARSFSLSIDKTKTTGLTGEIEIAFWSNMSTASYTVSDIKLLPPPVLWLAIERDASYVAGPIWSWIASDQTHSMKGRFTKNLSDQIKAIPGAELWVYWTGTGGYGRIETNASLNASGGSGVQKIIVSSITFPAANDGVFDFNIYSASGGIDRMEVYYPAGATVAPFN